MWSDGCRSLRTRRTTARSAGNSCWFPPGSRLARRAALYRNFPVEARYSVPTEVVNGSIWQGLVHSAVAAFSGASRMSCSLTRADARAISTALAAVASTAARLKSSEAANPQAPSAITRMPIPCDSESDALPTLPFLVESAGCGRRRCAPQHEAPRRVATSRAQEAMSCMALQSTTPG